MPITRLEERLKHAIRWLIAGYVVLAIGITVGLYLNWANSKGDERRSVAQDQRLMAQDNKQLFAIRTILCLADRQTQTSKQRTPDEKATSREFYRDALKSIDAPICDHWKE